MKDGVILDYRLSITTAPAGNARWQRGEACEAAAHDEQRNGDEQRDALLCAEEREAVAQAFVKGGFALADGGGGGVLGLVN